jgi:hypothetical protein
MGQAGEKAVGPSSPLRGGLKGVNQALADSVGQAQSLFGKLAAIVGTATGMFALGQAIREYVVSALEDGSEKAKDFSASLNFNDSKKAADELRAKIQQVEGDLAATKETYDAVRDAGFGATADLMRGPEVQAKLEQELAALRRSLRIEESKATADKVKEDAAAAKKASDAKAAEFDKWLDTYIVKLREERAAREESDAAEMVAYRDLLNKRIDASTEYNARVDKVLEDETNARDRQIEDFRQSMRDIGDEMTKQAKRSQDAWVDSLRAIREESNRAFNTDQAATMVQLAGNLRTTATIATANMNRIVVGGDD